METDNDQSKWVDIPDSWYTHLKPIIETDYFKKLSTVIKKDREVGNVFPSKENVFRAFNLTPLNKVRVVILGMDPYPNLFKGEPVACGLAFAPSNKLYVPPSLRMIHACLKNTLYDGQFKPVTEMDLLSWANQGVFLLNAALTVKEGKAGSHLHEWNQFTNYVIKTISEKTSGTIFCFWGKDAQNFAGLVNERYHYVLKAPHPVSAVYKGGDWECNHFEFINETLKKNNNQTIEWL